MHLQRESSKESEQLWRDKVLVAQARASELQGQLQNELEELSNMKHVTAESALPLDTSVCSQCH